MPQRVQGKQQLHHDRKLLWIRWYHGFVFLVLEGIIFVYLQRQLGRKTYHVYLMDHKTYVTHESDSI